MHVIRDRAGQDRAALRLPNNPFSYHFGVGSTPLERTVTVAVRPGDVAILPEVKVWTDDIAVTIQHTAVANPPIGVDEGGYLKSVGTNSSNALMPAMVPASRQISPELSVNTFCYYLHETGAN